MFIQQFFQKQAVFSETTLKNCFGGTFNHFWGKGASCPKINLVFFITSNLGTEYFII